MYQPERYSEVKVLFQGFECNNTIGCYWYSKVVALFFALNVRIYRRYCLFLPTSCTIVRNEIFRLAKCFKSPFSLQDFADEQKEKADAAFKDAEYRSHLSFCRWIVLEVEVFVSFIVVLLSRYRRSQDVQVGKLVNA